MVDLFNFNNNYNKNVGYNLFQNKNSLFPYLGWQTSYTPNKHFKRLVFLGETVSLFITENTLAENCDWWYINVTNQQGDSEINKKLVKLIGKTFL